MCSLLHFLMEEALSRFLATNVRLLHFLKLDFVSASMSNMEYALLAMLKKKSKLYQKALALFTLPLILVLVKWKKLRLRTWKSLSWAETLMKKRIMNIMQQCLGPLNSKSTTNQSTVLLCLNLDWKVFLA